MEGVTIIETKVLQDLILSVQTLKEVVVSTITDLNEHTKPYLNVKETCKLLGKSENWLLLHRQDIGSSKRTGTLLFKRKDIEAFIEEDYFKQKRA